MWHWQAQSASAGAPVVDERRVESERKRSTGRRAGRAIVAFRSAKEAHSFAGAKGDNRAERRVALASAVCQCRGAVVDERRVESERQRHGYTCRTSHCRLSLRERAHILSRERKATIDNKGVKTI